LPENVSSLIFVLELDTHGQARVHLEGNHVILPPCMLMTCPVTTLPSFRVNVVTVNWSLTTLLGSIIYSKMSRPP
jgi:hypothetical protein